MEKDSDRYTWLINLFGSFAVVVPVRIEQNSVQLRTGVEVGDMVGALEAINSKEKYIKQH